MTPLRSVAPFLVLSALFGCIADITGAPCVTQATCPDGQACVGGFCTAPGGGGGGSAGGGSGSAGGGASGGAGGGMVILNCKGCSSTSNCATGEVCGRRYCDGRSACYNPKTPTTCTRIDSAACSAAPYFGVCSQNADCPPSGLCVSSRCLVKCTVAADCAIPNATYTAFVAAACVATPLTNNDARCYPACSRAGDAACPNGSSCQPLPAGGYGYCKPQ